MTDDTRERRSGEELGSSPVRPRCRTNATDTLHEIRHDFVRPERSPPSIANVKATSVESVDHCTSESGIFIIETKYYSGWIHGHEKSEYWTQTIYRERTKFGNPIRQNCSHVYALKEVLSDFPHIRYRPLVVFAGTTELVVSRILCKLLEDGEVFRSQRRGLPGLFHFQCDEAQDGVG